MDLQFPAFSKPSQATSLSKTSPRSSVPRSRNGCWTCRSKKVKCDEVRPQCKRCIRLKLLCDYSPRKKEPRIGWQVVRSQRRRIASDADTASTFQHSRMEERFRSLSRHDEAMYISTCRLPMPSTSTSSVALNTNDHEAIRYFRTSFAKMHHTKNPDFSLYSIMLRIAEVDPIVMHMVLAVGGRELMSQRSLRAGASSPSFHYSNALKLMADAIGNQSATRLDFDSLNTALYLMLLYEQKYGDEGCAGVVHHLNGAALILKHLYNDKTGLVPPVPGPQKQTALAFQANGSDYLSLYGARLILWMIKFDTSAASFGVGGQLNSAMCMLLDPDAANDGCVSPLDKFDHLHRFSNGLYRTMWGDEYPQSELLDDVENRTIFYFDALCSQLRFMVTRLARLQESDPEAADKRAVEVERSIDSVREMYGELIEVSAGLSVATDNSHRLVANIRAIVPHFHAVVLSFLRLRGRSQNLGLSRHQVEALRQIMNLAFQLHKHDGDKAMAAIAWPLFMVALETNDHLHREWVLSRFSAMGKFGHNFKRANEFLVSVIGLQDRLGRRVDVRGKLKSGELGLFVI